MDLKNVFGEIKTYDSNRHLDGPWNVASRLRSTLRDSVPAAAVVHTITSPAKIVRLQGVPSNWQRHIQINQYGCFLGMKAVVPAMERSGGGSIVNISSVAGLKGSPGSFAYAATKWALRGMTKSAAIDLGGRKIRVNSVHPGPIDTDMIAFRTPEQREERIKQVPMHRYGTPEEVAQLVAFLLSDESSYITGAEIAIDGAASA